MSRKYRLSTALDIDDLLMECVAYAIRLANEKYQFDPPLSIYEIAAASGFSDIYNFSRLFKAKTGSSPTEFRKTIAR